MRSRRTLDDRSAQALLSGRVVEGEPELTAFVAALSAEVVAGEPSAALAAMLADGFVPVASAAPVTLPRARRSGARRWALQVSLGTAACVAVSLGAAANDLPAPVQTTVADVVEALTPLTVPRPAQDSTPAEPTDSTTSPATQVEPTAEPSEEATTVPLDQPQTRATESGGDGATSEGDTTQPDGGTPAEPRADARDDHPATSQPDVVAPPSLPSEQPDSHQGSTDDSSGSSAPTVGLDGESEAHTN